MDLAELRFKVITDDLEKAADKLEALGAAVQKLNKPMTESAAATAKVAKEQAKAEEAAVKAAIAAEKLQKAQEKSTEAGKKSISVLEKQNLILEYMAQGNSRGQASIMATYKAAGALDSQMLELNNTLKTQRTLIGGDPFDKSIGLMQKLQNEYKNTSEITSLFNRNLGLTEKQMTDIAREKQRLIALYKIEGKDISGLSAEYENLIKQSVQINAQNDLRTNSMKNQIKAVSDTAKANEYLTKELYRVDSALKEENKTLSSGTNNALLRFEKALKASGMTASEQTVKLEAYRQKLLQLQKASGDRQVDYLSRALGPQITDIAVGLATGQNPLTVMLQQGGQLRDQFALAGVAGKDMGEMLKTAAASMVTSVKDVAMAVGGLLVSSLMSVGQAVMKTVLAPFTLMKTVLGEIAAGTLTLASATEALKVAFAGLSKSGLLLIVTAVATLAVEYYKLTTLQSSLSKSIAMTGASFGMSTKQAEAFASNMAKSGGSTLQFMAILNDFAKAGAKADETTIRLAKDLEKYAGVAAEKTAESYAKLSDAPTKGLLDIAKAQGFVSRAVLDKVHKLEEEGKTYEAIALAQQAWKDSNQQAINVILSELNPLQELWIKIKDGVTAAGQAVYEFASSSAVVNVLTTVWETFAVIVAEVWFVLKQTVQTVIDLVNILAAPVGTKLAVFDAAVEAAQKAREEHDKTIATILNRKEATKGLTDEEVKQREANANAAKVAEDRWKKEKESFDFFQASMKSAKDLIIGTTQAQGELNDAERKYLEITNDPKYAKLTEARQKELKWLFDIAAVKVDQLKLDKQIKDENLKLAEENADLMLQAKLIGASDMERKRAIKTRKAEVELQKELVEIEKSSKGDIEAARTAAYERYAQKVKNANTEISIELANNLTTSLTDAVMTGLTEGGKAGSKKLRDLIKAELMKPITVVVQAVIGSIVQGTIGNLTGQAASSAGGSLLSSATASMIGSFGGKELAASFSSGALSSAYGAGFKAAWGGSTAGGAEAAGMLEGGAATGTSAAGSAGYYSAYAAGAVGGMALNRGISGDYQISKDVSTIQDIATIAATAVFGPVGGIIAGAASGLMNRAFGMGSKEVTASGISGTFSAKGADVQSYQKWQQSGGWFRSDKSGTDFSAISSQLKDVLDFALGASTGLTSSFAKLIGATTDGIDNFTKQVDISLQGLDAAGQQKALEDAITAYGEDLASLIVGPVLEVTFGVFAKSLNPLIKVGETASQALSRLATSLTTVNNVLDTLNHVLLNTSVAGADAASKLADAFGGLDNFTAATASYYEAFYTESERNAKTTERLTKVFADLGYQMPTSLQDFRDLVDSQNLYSDAGRNTYATLLGLSSAFATVTNAASDAAKAAQDQADALAKAAEDALKSAKNLLQKSGESISDWLKKLTLASIPTPTQTVSTTRSQYLKDLTLSQVGDQTALGNLTTSAQSYLDAARSASTSSAQYRLAIAQVATQVAALPVVKSWNDEVLLKLDLIATYTKGTAASSTETAQNTLDSYLQAIKSLAKLGLISNYTSDAYTEAVKAQGTLGLINYNTDGSENALLKSLTELGIIKSSSDETATNTYDAYTQSVKQVDYLIKLNNNALYNVYAAIGESAVKMSGYLATMDASLSKIAANPTTVNVSTGGGFSLTDPSSWFADGGVFGGTGIYSEPTAFMQPTGQLGVMGEAGPEAVMPLERLADGALGVRAVTSIGYSGDNSMLWQAIDRLNTNLDGLRAETRATVVNTSKTAKLLDRVVESDTLKVQTIVV